MEALRRQISSNSYNAADPLVVPIREDKRYRSWTTTPQPQTTAVVFYIMDVSGSMTDEQKQIVRTEAFWLDTWLASQYDGIEVRYIIHDAVAREVDEETFYHTRESGGTRISSGYKVCLELMQTEFSRLGLEHLLLPVLRRRQLGGRQRAKPANCCATNSCRTSTCSATAKSRAPTAAANTSAPCTAPSAPSTKN